MRDHEWLRADPEALAAFDPTTKTCVMNCGPHVDDPRSALERLFLCDECDTTTPSAAQPRTPRAQLTTSH